MVQAYDLAGERIDSIDLKALVISRGVRVSGKLYSVLGNRARVSANPLDCSCILLPDGTVVQLTDLSFHMSYVRSAISWDMMKQLRHLRDLKTPFSLEPSDGSTAILSYEGTEVTTVTFPPASRFYDQHTSSGLPFRGNAVLQGREWVSFQCLWSCDYACAGLPCQYCYSGGVFEARTRRKKQLPRFPGPQDAAEIVEYAMGADSVTSMQITGGSTFDTATEGENIRRYLEAIFGTVGRETFAGEVLVYATPPRDPRTLDPVFAAGADRVSCSLEIWDEDLAREIMPGKSRYTPRPAQLASLEHVVGERGRGTACSNFIIGLEPAASCLEGAEYLAARGVVPIASVWIPFGRPVRGSMRAPDLEYYRAVKHGLARIYRTYGIEPPGGAGLNVCIDRDIYLHLDELSPVTTTR